MKRIEIYIDNNNKLVISEFKSINSEYENKTFKGSSVYGYIRNLAKSPILNIKETEEDIIIEYKNCVVRLNEVERILRTSAIKPLLSSINTYQENKKLKQVKNKKVTRKKKHNKCKIIASGLALATIISIGSALSEENFFVNHKTYEEPNTHSMSDVILEDKTEDLVVIEDAETTTPEVEEKVTTVSIPYEDRSDTTRANKTISYYGDTIKKYAETYGLDYELPLAIATQERGIHSSTKDKGGATGLMQIQNSVWSGKELCAFNYKTGKKEKIIVNEKSLSDVYYNIKVGCMILQKAMDYMDNNIIAGIQCYNMGSGNMNTILNAYSQKTNRTVDEILADPYDTGWMNYRYLIKRGDQKYVERVLSWLGTDVDLYISQKDGNTIDISINNNTNKKIY